MAPNITWYGAVGAEWSIDRKQTRENRSKEDSAPTWPDWILPEDKSDLGSGGNEEPGQIPRKADRYQGRDSGSN